MKIVLAGGTGFIGKAVLDQLLRMGRSVVLLSRNKPNLKNTERQNLKPVEWDGKTPGAWFAEVDGADAVINLAGEPIAAKRWTKAQKNKIVQSRLDAARVLVSAIEKSKRKPAVLVNASAVGYYGDVPEGDVNELSPKGRGFLAETCGQWEKEASEAGKYGTRVVLVRIGVVLGKDGGALQKFILPFKLFAGGPLGTGRQWFPWVHLEDVVNIICFALKETRLSGPVNAAAPDPVTMKEFCAAFGAAIHRPSWMPAPAFALKILLGEMSGMVLTGQRVIPKKLNELGYKFRHPALAEALESLKPF